MDSIRILSLKCRNKKAFYYFNKSAENENIDGAFNLATAYGTGTGVALDFERKRFWLEIASEADHAIAQYMLGIMLEYSNEIPREIKPAIYWYKRAASSNQVDAQKRLGFLYLEDPDVAQDLSLSFYWFHMAAIQGDAQAQERIGIALESGLGVPKNISEAQQWFKMADEQDNDRQVDP